MKPLIREIDKKYVEVIGHYDDPILCAKLTVIADMFAIEHKNGYAKFRIEDEDKLSFIDGKLEFTLDDAITVYINGTETGYIEGSEPWSHSIGRYASALPNVSISDGKVLCNGKQLYLNGVAVNSTDYPVGGAYYLTTAPAGDSKISIGASAIAKAFVGSSDVTAMYLGSTKIYEKP